MTRARLEGWSRSPTSRPRISAASGAFVEQPPQVRARAGPGVDGEVGVDGLRPGRGRPVVERDHLADEAPPKGLSQGMRTGGGCRARASVRFSGPGPGAAGASRRGESGVPATTCARELVGSPAVDDPAAGRVPRALVELTEAQAARRCAAGTCCGRMSKTASRCPGWPPRRGCRFGPPRAGRPATGPPACLGSMVRDTPDGRKLGCRRAVETAC